MLPIAIIAGGLGTRLGPLTATLPKALVIVDGRPFIEHQLEMLRSSGFRRVVLCVSHLGQLIEQHLSDGSDYNLEIQYSYDGEELIGTAGAIAKALPLLGDDFFVTYGDSYLRCDYRFIQESYREQGKSGLMTIFRNEDAIVPSNVFYADHRIIAYNKRRPTPNMRYVDYGVSVFHRSVFAALDSESPTDLDVIFQQLISKNDLAALDIATRFYEIGTPHGLAETEAFLRSQ